MMATQEATTADLQTMAGVEVERTTTRDKFTGTVAALVAAGIIEPRHLEAQPGRRRGRTHFMPDGSPVPSGITPPAYLPGALTVQAEANGLVTACRAVSVEERARREDAEPTLRGEYNGRRYFRGSKERLIQDGIPGAWLDGLPAPGKKRGRRTHYEGENKIEVCVTENGARVEITHISYYEYFGRVSYLRMRAEYGLTLIERKHLRLVWAA